MPALGACGRVVRTLASRSEGLRFNSDRWSYKEVIGLCYFISSKKKDMAARV